MIYTIGHQETYLDAIASSPDGVISKTGKRPMGEDFEYGYSGGYAFESFSDAQKRIDEKYQQYGYAVFGLNASWNNDTVEQAKHGGWWHYLLVDTEIVVLENNGKQKT